jgi:eukaryotic-like serine/threonine-protein kinase
MSEVYRGRDTVLGRLVAVKMLTAQACRNEDTRARFLLEARVSSGISHPNIITTYDYGELDGLPYMVLEFLTGRTLKEVLAAGESREKGAGEKGAGEKGAGETIDLRKRVFMAAQLARALAHVHSLKLVHRDIKPDNVHVDSEWRVKLMDFGVVKTEDITLTQAGYALGTPHYVAPEIVLGQAVTPLVDVYSFGVLLYEVLSGRRAIQADTVERIFFLILNEPLDFAPLSAAGVPEELQAIVRGVTAREPKDRTPSMAVAAEQLEAWLDANPTQKTLATQAALPDTQSKRRVQLDNRLLAALVALSIVLAALLFFMMSNANPLTAREPQRVEDAAGDMVFIPAGSFPQGANRSPANVAAFFLDVTEVTNEEYEEFCTATKHPLPEGFKSGSPGMPIVNITITDAQAFAKWANKRLPTALEWEKAARGIDGRSYPWGPAADTRKANVKDNPDESWHTVVSADAFRHGRGPYTHAQLVGNVKEFTADTVAPTVLAMRSFANLLSPPPTADELWYVVKGGSFQSLLVESNPEVIEVIPARFKAPDLGFRCARDPK